MQDNSLLQAPLGKKSQYQDQYDPSLLFRLPRKPKRDEIRVGDTLPFQGTDIWNAYELSWLDQRGKPVVATGEFIIPCESPNIVESKALKLYLNSFNGTRFESPDRVEKTLMTDLSEAIDSEIQVRLFSPNEEVEIGKFRGTCLDQLEISCNEYLPNPSLLKVTKGTDTEEVLYTHLLKSNCLVTGQPDWGSLQIGYSGSKIDHAALLKYIVSLRNHNEFHEQCVERIFMDILRECQPRVLSVYARYTRRGGLDINPFRTNDPNLKIENRRLSRQ